MVPGDDGVAALELALVLSILILLVFGIVEFGRLFNAQITLTHSAREGVRVLAVTQDAAAAADAARDAATSLDPAQMTISNTACDAGTVGTATELTAEYPFQLNIPFFGSRSIGLSATGVMRCGG